jgi:hypothetical protein
MATFFFRAESFGSDPGSTGHVGLSGGGKLLSWRDWISASLFNMEIRPSHHTAKIWRKTSACGAIGAIFKHPPFVQSSGDGWCSILPFIGCNCANRFAIFYLLNTNTSLELQWSEQRSKYGFESSETLWKCG